MIPIKNSNNHNVYLVVLIAIGNGSNNGVGLVAHIGGNKVGGIGCEGWSKK